MSTLFHPLPRILAGLVIMLQLTGCGTYIVAKTVTGAGSLVVGGAVGAVKLTGKAAGAVTDTVVGLAQEEDDQAG